MAQEEASGLPSSIFVADDAEVAPRPPALLLLPFHAPDGTAQRAVCPLQVYDVPMSAITRPLLSSVDPAKVAGFKAKIQARVQPLGTHHDMCHIAAPAVSELPGWLLALAASSGCEAGHVRKALARRRCRCTRSSHSQLAARVRTYQTPIHDSDALP